MELGSSIRDVRLIVLTIAFLQALHAALLGVILIAADSFVPLQRGAASAVPGGSVSLPFLFGQIPDTSLTLLLAFAAHAVIFGAAAGYVTGRRRWSWDCVLTADGVWVLAAFCLFGWPTQTFCVCAGVHAVCGVAFADHVAEKREMQVVVLGGSSSGRLDGMDGTVSKTRRVTEV